MFCQGSIMQNTMVGGIKNGELGKKMKKGKKRGGKLHEERKKRP